MHMYFIHIYFYIYIYNSVKSRRPQKLGHPDRKLWVVAGAGRQGRLGACGRMNT